MSGGPRRLSTDAHFKGFVFLSRAWVGGKLEFKVWLSLLLVDMAALLPNFGFPICKMGQP